MSEPTPQATATWRAWTIRLLLTVVGLVIGYDFLAYSMGGQDATITQVLRDNSAEWTLIPLFAGIVAGHIWWSGWLSKFYQPNTPPQSETKEQG